LISSSSQHTIARFATLPPPIKRGGPFGQINSDLIALSAIWRNMPATSQRVFVGASDRVAEGKRLVVDVGDATIGIFRVEGSSMPT
jgi:hypothetical protein